MNGTHRSPHTHTHTHLFQSKIFLFKLQDVMNFLFLVLMAQKLGILTAECLNLLLSILALTQQ